MQTQRRPAGRRPSRDAGRDGKWRSARCLPKLRGGKEGVLPRDSAGAEHCGHLDFGLLDWRTLRE